jgi:predicted DNA-binding protein with PD1-like motif
MRHRRVDETPKTRGLIFETGDELAEGLQRFAVEHERRAASFKAVGALSSVRLAWFSRGHELGHEGVRHLVIDPPGGRFPVSALALIKL